MDTEMRKPEIATILDDGTYGQREMTEQEYAEYLMATSQMEPFSDAVSDNPDIQHEV